MILIVAVLAGAAAALLRAGLTRRPLQFPFLHSPWLVALAYLPQWLAIQNGSTARLIPDPVAAASLVGSQLILLLFAWRNRHVSGIGLLALGLVMNLSVIVANGGFMPIFPDMVSELFPDAAATWQTGERLWLSKNVVLPPSATHLPWLADRFRLPEWVPLTTAFSLGDIVIGLGAFRLLWAMGSEKEAKEYMEDIHETSERFNVQL